MFGLKYFEWQLRRKSVGDWYLFQRGLAVGADQVNVSPRQIEKVKPHLLGSAELHLFTRVLQTPA